MNGSVRVAAVGDLHCKRSSPGAFQALFSRIAETRTKSVATPGPTTV